jgi:glycosyltransferase involved in cell wall biosynthesis
MRDDVAIAVLIPCYNEQMTIAKVVSDFRAAIPGARIYVYDNNSTDDSVARARQAGATVRSETLQGKGNVIRRMFADIDSDVYVLVDGDDTYDASRAPDLVEDLLEHRLDMVNAARVPVVDTAYRPGHREGNALFAGVVRLVFGDRIRDLLSGYRVLSRRFVKSFPALSTGFEIETELTVHALELRMPVMEMETAYKDRPAGSLSKLRTIRDGFRILKMIALLVKEERPMPFFSLVFAALALLSLVLAYPIFVEFLETGLVPRFPTAILSTGLMMLAFLSLACGLILDTVTLARRELKRLHYLAISVFDRSSPADCTDGGQAGRS